MTKAPYMHHQKMKIKRQHKVDTKNFDYTAIADRLMAASWSGYCHPTGVVKPVHGILTFQLTTTVVYM